MVVRLGRTLVALGILACAPLAPAATCTFIGPDNGSWDVPGNWSGCTGGSGQTADTPGLSDTAIVNSLSRVNIDGLDIEVGVLQLAGGIVEGDAPMVVQDLQVTSTQSEIRGDAGRTLIRPLQVDGGNIASTLILRDRQLVLNGGATLTLPGGGRLVAQIQPPPLPCPFASQPGSICVSPTAVLDIRGGSGNAIVESNIYNAGDVVVASGNTLDFFESNVFQYAAGRIVLESGTLTISGGNSLLEISGGTLNGTGTINSNVAFIGGTVDPDDPGYNGLDITGNANFSRGTRLLLDVLNDNTTPTGNYDQIRITGNVRMDGIYDVRSALNAPASDFTLLTGTLTGARSGLINALSLSHEASQGPNNFRLRRIVGADICEWNKILPSQFDDPQNWDNCSGSFPQANDAARIDTPSVVSINTPITVARLQLANTGARLIANAPLTITEYLHWTSGQFVGTGGVTLGATADGLIGGTLDARELNNTTLTLNGTMSLLAPFGISATSAGNIINNGAFNMIGGVLPANTLGLTQFTNNGELFAMQQTQAAILNRYIQTGGSTNLESGADLQLAMTGTFLGNIGSAFPSELTLVPSVAGPWVQDSGAEIDLQGILRVTSPGTANGALGAIELSVETGTGFFLINSPASLAEVRVTNGGELLLGANQSLDRLFTTDGTLSSANGSALNISQLWELAGNTSLQDQSVNLGSSAILRSTSNATLDLLSASSVSLAGQLLLENFDLAITGSSNFNILDAAVLQLSGSQLSLDGGSGNLVLPTNAILRGDGTITGNLSNTAGVISPGNFGTGTLTVTGSLLQGTAGRMELEIVDGGGGGQRGFLPDTDQITVTGSATLGGIANIVNPQGFNPLPIQQFPLISYASQIGSFDTTNLPPEFADTHEMVVNPTNYRMQPRAIGGLDCTWIGDVGPWGNPSNWSCGSAPGPGDTARVLNSSDVVDATPGGQRGTQRNVGTLIFADGRIEGSGNLFIEDDLQWTAGTFAGVDALNDRVFVGPSATASFTGTATRRLEQRTFVNQGQMTWNAGNVELVNGPSLINASGAMMTIDTSSGFFSLLASGSGSPGFANLSGGSITKTGNTVFSTDVVYSEGGALNIDGGTFQMLFHPGPGFVGATINSFAELSLVDINPFTYDNTVSFLGSGAVSVAGTATFDGSFAPTLGFVVNPNAVATINTPGTVTFAELVLSASLGMGGRLDGSSDLVVDVLSWGGGEISGNPGTTLVINGTSSVIIHSDPKILSTRELQAQSLRWQEGDLDVRNGGKLVITGSFNMNSNGFPGTRSMTCSAACATPVISNQSLLRAAVDFDALYQLQSSVSVENLSSGTIDVRRGRLNIEGVLSNAGSIDLGAALTDQAVLGRTAGPITVGSGERLRGLGLVDTSVVLTGGARIEPDGFGKDITVGLEIQGNLDQSGGVAVIDLEGSNPGQFDQIIVSGNVTPGAVEPQGPGLSPGDSVPFITHATRSGGYSSLVGAQAGGYTLDNTLTSETRIEAVGGAPVDCTWTAAAGSWATAGNWSCGQVPGAADTARVLSAAANVDIAGNRTVAVLELSDGVIGGSGVIDVTSSLLWNGGTFDGGNPASDQINLNNGATGTFGTGGGSNRVLRRRTFGNGGVINWTGGDLEIAVTGTEFSNNNTVSFANAANLEIRSDGAPGVTFHNTFSATAINKSGAGGVLIRGNIGFLNGAPVVITDGKFVVQAEGTDNGQYTITSGAFLDFEILGSGLRNLVSGSSISGSGQLTKKGTGTLRFDSIGIQSPAVVTRLEMGVLQYSGSQDFSSLTVIGGELAGSGETYNVANTFQFSGGTISGSPLTSLNVLNTVTTAQLDGLGKTLNRRGLNIASTVDWTAGNINLQNGAGISIQASGNLNANLASPTSVVDNGGGTQTFTNLGTFNKNGAAALSLGVPLGGAGTVAVNDGQLQLPQHVTGSFVGATITTPGILQLGGSTPFTYTSGVSFNGNGTVAALSGMGLTFQGNLASSLRLVAVGGEFVIDAAPAITVQSIQVNVGSVLRGSSNLSTTEFTWLGGQISGTPGTRLTITGLLGIIGGAPGELHALDTRMLDVTGGLTWASGNIDARNLAQIGISSSGLLDMSAMDGTVRRLQCTVNCAAAVVDNNGIVRVDGAPVGHYLFEASVGVNNGTGAVLDLRNGQLAIDGALQSPSQINLGSFANTAVFGRSSAGTFSFDGTLIRGSGTIVASLVAGAGTRIEPMQNNAGPIGLIAITGDFDHAMGGIVAVDVNGVTPGQFDQITVSGDVTPGDVEPAGTGLTTGQNVPFITHATRSAPYSSLVGANASDYNFDNALTTQTRLIPAGPLTCTWNHLPAPPNTWENVAHWSCGAVPGPGDIAILDNPEDMVSLTQAVTVGTLDLRAGRIDGDFKFNIADSFLWSGGTFAATLNAVTTEVLPGGSATLSGTQKTADTRTISLAADASWTAGLIELRNGGRFVIGSGVTFTANPGATPEFFIGTGSSDGELLNLGGIVKLGPNEAGSDFHVIYNGGGSLDVQAGAYKQRGSGTVDGAISVASGAFLEFSQNNRSFSSSSSITGAGTLRFGDASVFSSVNTIAGSFTPSGQVQVHNADLVLAATGFSLPSLALQNPDATVTSDFDFTVTNTLNWNQGTIRGLMGGAGLTLTNGATADLTALNPRELRNIQLVNQGTLNFDGSLLFANQAELRNEGMMNVNTASGAMLRGAGGSPNSFINANGSTLRKNGLGDLTIGSLTAGEELDFSNSGTVDVPGGTILLFQGGSDSGSYTLAAGSVLRTSGNGARVFNGPISGSGTLQVADDSTATVRGTLSLTRLRVDNSAQADLDTPGVTVSIPELDLQGGQLFGTDAISTANLQWRGGTISGTTSETLTVTGPSFVAVSPEPRLLSGRQLLIGAPLVWQSGDIEMQNSALMSVLAAGRFELNSSSPGATYQLFCGGSCGTPQLSNDGELVKTGDASIYNLQASISVSNNGLLQVDNGELNPLGSFSTGASSVIDINGGGTVRTAPGGTLNVSQGLLAGNGVLVANLDFGSTARFEPGPGNGVAGIGVFTIGGDFSHQGTLQIDVNSSSPGTFDLVQVLGNVLTTGPVEPVGSGLGVGEEVAFIQHSARNEAYDELVGPNAGAYSFNNIFSNETRLVGGAGGTIEVDRSDDPTVRDVAPESLCVTGIPADCSLRQAIALANAVGGTDTITFNIPGAPGQVHVIEPSTPLPMLNESVNIVGSTQNGYVANTNATGAINAQLKIVLDGSSVPKTVGLQIPSFASVSIHAIAMVDFDTALLAESNGFTLTGSSIGVHPDGVTDSACLEGVVLGGGQIGGLSPASRNVIAGCDTNIITIGERTVTIQHNLIGATADNTQALPGQVNGIYVASSCEKSAPTINIFDNVIVGHESGIEIEPGFPGFCFGNSTVNIMRNAIGVNALTSGAPIANSNGIVWLGESSPRGNGNTRIVVGDANVLMGNTIAGNTEHGIAVANSARFVAIGRNVFQDNGELAIDLRADLSPAEIGVRTVNDVADPDFGGNNLQNFPVITAISGQNVTYFVDSSGANSNYGTGLQVDFYRNDDGQGVEWLGSDTYGLADYGTGSPPGTRVAVLTGTLNPGDELVAIATDSGGNSSEFSFVRTQAELNPVMPDPASIGSPRTVSGRVFSSDGTPFQPTGTILITDGVDSCSPSLTPGAPGESLFSCALPTTGTPGQRQLNLTYTADDRIFENASALGSSTVELGGLITTTTIATTNPSPSAINLPYTVTVTVMTAPRGPSQPTGSVTVLAAPPFDSETCVAMLTSGVTSSTGSCQITPTAPGVRILNAAYPGDVGFLPSSTIGGFNHVVQGTASFPTNGIIQTPEETEVGQPFTVLVPVLGNGITPSGTVTVTPLPVGNAQTCMLVSMQTPNLAECTVQLVAPVAVGKVLRVRYNGSTDMVFPPAETLLTHNTTRATTAVRILSDTPDPSDPKQPVTVQFEVSAAAGAISTFAPLNGSVTVSDGLDSCTGSLTSVTTGTLTTGSCTISPRASGLRQFVASYQGNENFNGNDSPAEPHTVNGSGVGNDLSVRVRNGLRMVNGGTQIEYTIEVFNAGATGAGSTRVQVPLPAQMPNASWNCVPVAPSQCPQSGTGAIDRLVDLVGGGQVTFRIRGLIGSTEGTITTSATVTPATGITDPDLGNNSASDTDLIGVFSDGFEDPANE